MTQERISDERLNELAAKVEEIRQRHPAVYARLMRFMDKMLDPNYTDEDLAAATSELMDIPPGPGN